jgi:hypothetical protein
VCVCAYVYVYEFLRVVVLFYSVLYCLLFSLISRMRNLMYMYEVVDG